jgi:hypothetical protein
MRQRLITPDMPLGIEIFVSAARAPLIALRTVEEMNHLFTNQEAVPCSE